MGKLQLEISRPFRLGGFATGDYMCKCMTCGGEFTGDKRAMTCLPCVADRINAARSEAQPSDGGKSLGERFYEGLVSATSYAMEPWRNVPDMLKSRYERAALTFTASLSDASPKPSSDEQET